MEIILILLQPKFIMLVMVYIITFTGVNSFFLDSVKRVCENVFLATIGGMLTLTLIGILSENPDKVNLTFVYLDNSIELIFIAIFIIKVKMNLHEWRMFLTGSFYSYILGALFFVQNYIA